MGIPPEDDALWADMMNAALGAGDPDLNPGGVESVVAEIIPEIFRRCNEMIAARRENPTDDLTSVLVHAEVDGEKLEEHEIVMGFFLLVAAGQRQHEGHLLQRDEGADGPSRGAAEAARRPVAGPERGRGGAADVPRVRPLPPDGDVSRAPERRGHQGGREGRHVVRLVEPRRDELRGSRALRRRRAARTTTRRSAPAAATSASAPRSRGSSSRSCSRRR